MLSKDSSKEKQSNVGEKRANADQLNSMCIRCITDCPGTFKKLWTGCVYRKTN